MDIVNIMSANRRFSVMPLLRRIRKILLREFRAAVGTYVEIPAWTAGGDAHVSVLFYASEFNSNQSLFTLGAAMVRANSPTALSVWTDVDVPPATFTVPNMTGALNQLSVTFTANSNTVALELNGVGYTANAGGVTKLTGGEFAIGKWSSRYFNGIISRVALTDLANPANSRLYTRFAEPDGIVPNDLAELGVDVAPAIPDWNFQAAADWTLDDGRLYCRAAASGGVLNTFATVPTEVGQWYLITFDLEWEGQAGRIAIYFGGVWTSYLPWYAPRVDKFSALIQAESADQIVQIRSNDADGGIFNGWVSNVSAIVVSGYGTMQNAADGSATEFTLNTSTDPDQLENADKSVVIPLAPGVEL